ncbi:AzlC family ABC transporter permease [Lacrimispora sp. NSJ-141]|uniref:AzlC family ABC transporter permease n=1 Tax=Lientehia hominis TaxID=2897778 RepID=A0AAP2RLQ0_9FIRM|nr:AzlC family ABC transporter permease [Lientehia hominis]MCD2493463.1 AzlC family ABC transporter permease [Lientehia hominis]
MIKKAFRAAFPLTLPVFMGYLFLGIAFGVLLSSEGFHVGWAIFMSVIIYAGSMQFVAIELLTLPFNFLSTLLITLMVNARHLFYGLSMLDKFKDSGKLKPYMIFSLTDETFSLLCSANPPDGVSKKWFFFFIAVLNHFYWILGGVIGNAAGNLIPFNSKGIDFAMTALFIVIFVDQWENSNNHLPAVLGIVITAACRLLFGTSWFIPAAMLCLLFSLTMLRRRESA